MNSSEVQVNLLTINSSEVGARIHNLSGNNWNQDQQSKSRFNCVILTPNNQRNPFPIPSVKADKISFSSLTQHQNMDLILNYLEPRIFHPLYHSLPFPLNPILSTSISIFLVSLIGVNILYFTLSTLSYYFIYDHSLMDHPKFLKNQIQLEIKLSTSSFPITAICTVPWFLFEVLGYSKLYNDVGEYGYLYLVLSFGVFLMFTDFGVYWIHRFEHHPMLYSWLHKPHHKWKVTTPFASFAFHPLVSRY